MGPYLSLTGILKGAAAAIGLASQFSIQLSTTHTISTSIIGIGSAQRFSAVLGIGAGDCCSLGVDFPVCGAIAWLTATILHRL